MATTELGAATVFRADGAGWYNDGTGGTNRWGSYAGNGQIYQNWVLRYTITTGSVPWLVTGLTWASGGTYTYYGDSNNNNKIPYYVFATSTQANSIQVADTSGGGTSVLRTGAIGSKVTARTNGTTATSGSAPNKTGLSITLAANTTYYLYLYGNDAGTSSNSHYGWNYCTGKCTVTYTTYTACGAPTSVTASGIIKPSGSFTVSWSGATAGTSNAINGYQVYWYVTSGGTAPTTSTYTGTASVSSTATSGSYTVTLSNATRNYKVVCGVVTKGAAGSSYYSSIKTGGSVTINSLPNKPSLNKSSQTIVSTSSGISVTATAGTDTNTSQTLSVWYATSTAHANEQKYTSAITMNPSAGSSLTYYFWTWDGLEYSSSYTSITVTKNNASSLSATYDKNTYKYGSGGTSYDIPSNLKITATKSNAGSNLTVAVSLIYNASNGTPSSSNSISINSALAITSGTQKSLSVNPQSLVSSVYNKSYNLNYRIVVSYSDGYESTKTVTLPSSSTNFVIPAAPSVTNLYNQQSTADIDGTTANYLCRKGRIYFNNDTAMTSYAISANDGTAFTATVDSSGTDGNKKYLNFTFSRLPASGSNITLTVTLSNSTTLKKSFTYTCHAINFPEFSNVTSANTTLYPFGVDNNTPTIATDKMAWPFGSSTTIETAATNYSFAESNLKFAFCASGSDATIREMSGSFTKAADTSLAFTYAAASTTNYTNCYVVAFDKNGSNTDDSIFGITSYSGTKSVRSRIQLTNLYGEIFTQYCNHTINFNKSTSNPVVTYGVYYGNYEQVYYQEGLALKATDLKFTYYTEGTYSYILEVAKTDSPSDSDWSEVLTGSLGSLTNTVQTGSTFNLAELIDESLATPIEIISSISQVTDTLPRTFRMKVYTGSITPSIEQSPDTFDVIKQTAPTLIYESFNVDRTASGSPTVYTYEYTLENPQLSNIYSTSDSATLTNNAEVSYVCDIQGTTSLHRALIQQPDTTTYTTDPTDPYPEAYWERATRYIQVDTSVQNQSVNGTDPKYTSSISYYLGGYTVIVISPLIAYRVQKLGINTRAVSSGATIDIHAGAGDCVRLQGEGHTMLIDMTQGIIAFYSNITATDASDSTDRIHYINLTNGTLG